MEELKNVTDTFNQLKAQNDKTNQMVEELRARCATATSVEGDAGNQQSADGPQFEELRMQQVVDLMTSKIEHLKGQAMSEVQSNMLAEVQEKMMGEVQEMVMPRMEMK